MTDSASRIRFIDAGGLSVWKRAAIVFEICVEKYGGGRSVWVRRIEIFRINGIKNRR